MSNRGNGGAVAVPGQTAPRRFNNIGWGELDKGRMLFMIPFGSTLMRAIAFPFNMVKTNMQSAQNQYRGPVHALTTIARKEGFLALYKGFGTSLLGLPLGPVYISTLEMCRAKYADVERQHIGLPEGVAGGVVACAAGGSAAAVAQLLGVPIDIVAQHRMLQHGTHDAIGAVPRNASPLTILRQLIRTEGVLGMYRGYGMSVMTYGPSSAVTWGSHAVYCSILERWFPDAASDNPVATTPSATTGDPFADPRLGRDLAISGVAGGLAGLTTAVTTNGLDVIRTRQQTDATAKPVKVVVRELMQEHGSVRWWLRGASARALAMGPTTMMIMTLYQVLKRLALKQTQ